MSRDHYSPGMNHVLDQFAHAAAQADGKWTWVKIDGTKLTKREYVELIHGSKQAERNTSLVNTASIRDLVIQAGGMLDSALTELLSLALAPESHAILLGKSGKVRDFETKIELAYGLQLIEKTQRSVLNTIRSIRNQFAHDHDLLLFEHNEQVLGAVRSLPMSPSPVPIPLNLRFAFSAVGQLNRLQATSIALLSRVDPTQSSSGQA